MLAKLENFSIKVMQFPLTAVNSVQKIDVGIQTAMFIKDVDSLGSRFEISIQDSNHFVIANIGDKYTFEDDQGKQLAFDQIYIRNSVAGGGQAIVEFSNGVDIDRLPVIEPSTIKTGVLGSSLTIGTVATRIPTTAMTNRNSLLIINNSGATIFLGSATVGTATGADMLTGTSISFSILEQPDIFAIAVANANIRILEGG